MILAIDASNIKVSGGFKHLNELLLETERLSNCYKKIIIYGGNQIDNLPDYAKIVKFKPKLLQKGGLIRESIWKFFYAEKEFIKNSDIVFAPGGTFFSKKIPYISMSQNMLVFEKKERDRYKYSWTWIRLNILNILQRRSFNGAQAVIFISKYAQFYITNKSNINIKNHNVIYFGATNKFHSIPKMQKRITDYNISNPYKIIYVSAFAPYKHQDNLIEAIIQLRKNYPVELTLIGAYKSKDYKRIINILEKDHKSFNYIKILGLVDYIVLESYYHGADLFVFNSTCENMPNILIEAMSAGLPIVSSKFGPMPEFLKDAGVYMDPLDIKSIENGIIEMIENPELREKCSNLAYKYGTDLKWENCSMETFNFIEEIYKNLIK